MKSYFVCGHWGLIGSVDAPCIEVAWFRAIRVFGAGRFSHITEPNPPGVMGSSPAYVFWDPTPERKTFARTIPLFFMLASLYGKVAEYLKRKMMEYSAAVKSRQAERASRRKIKTANARREIKRMKTPLKEYASGFTSGFSEFVFDAMQSLIGEMNPVMYRAIGISITDKP